MDDKKIGKSLGFLFSCECGNKWFSGKQKEGNCFRCGRFNTYVSTKKYKRCKKKKKRANLNQKSDRFTDLMMRDIRDYCKYGHYGHLYLKLNQPDYNHGNYQYEDYQQTDGQYLYSLEEQNQRLNSKRKKKKEVEQQVQDENLNSTSFSKILAYGSTMVLMMAFAFKLFQKNRNTN